MRKQNASERRQTSRRAGTVGGRRQTDRAAAIQESLAALADAAQRVPVYNGTAALHACVEALRRADGPEAMRDAVTRLEREVDRALREDPLLQLEATIVRLRTALAEKSRVR